MLTGLHLVLEERATTAAVVFAEELCVGAVKRLLYLLKFVFRLLPEQFFVDAPELELQLQHLQVAHLLFI